MHHPLLCIYKRHGAQVVVVAIVARAHHHPFCFVPISGKLLLTESSSYDSTTTLRVLVSALMRVGWRGFVSKSFKKVPTICSSNANLLGRF